MSARFLLLTISLFASNSFAQSVHGVFRVVKGDVTVVSKSGEETKGKIGQKVFPSDKIKAGKDSRAKIVMVDKNEINISPDTEIVIENYQYKPEENKKNVLINVLYGKVRAKVEQKYDEGANKFQIKTPTAVAGVRGTDFITGYDAGTKVSQVVTFRGKVEFGLPGANGAILNSVFVTPGQMTSLTGSKPPTPPTEVPKSDLQNMDKSSDAAKSAPVGAQAPAPGPAKDGLGSEKRDPSSTDGTLKGGDLPSNGMVAPPPQLPPTQGPNITPGPVIPRPCDACRQAVEAKSRTLKINVRNGSNGP